VDCRFEFGASGLFGRELGGEWESKPAILRQYRAILLAYSLLGDHGIMQGWKFRGSWKLKSLIRGVLSRFKEGLFPKDDFIPGWYDTHARHSSVDAAVELPR
jgi:hypothetical protein